MHIQCTICSDLVHQAESLFVTKCGHIFHHQCLAQWLERSKSCPQCRNKVTERCMFRLFPTVSDGTREDAATLQARLDNAGLELRTQQARLKQLGDELAAATADASNKGALAAAAEARLVAQECAVAALRQQLQHARGQARHADTLRSDNQRLQQTLDTLHGLQRVLHAAAAEAEDTLRAYSDPRTVATFAAALKRALCEAEGKKRAWRARQLRAAADLAELQRTHKQLEAKVLNLERECEALKRKRKASEEEGPRAAKLPRAASPAAAGPPAETRLDDAVISEDDISFSSLVDRIVQSDSPYLNLQRSGLALCALRRRAPPARLKPSELAVLSSSATSIFRQEEAGAGAGAGAGAAPAGEGYDGLGGRARPDAFPRPPPRPAPRRARPRLRAPPAAGSRDLAAMFRALAAKRGGRGGAATP